MKTATRAAAAAAAAIRPQVRAGGLQFRYGKVAAVRDVSFAVRENCIVGLLGANGAGKTTIMRILAGFRVASGGAAFVCGHNLATARRRAQSHIGYLPESAAGFAHLTAAELLAYCCEARGITGAARTNAMAKVCSMLALDEVMPVAMRRLSKGWRQRVWLAQALLHEPKVLLLDEPTDGLDPMQKRVIRRLIKDLAMTRIVILSSHILEEVEEVCERAIIMHRGRIVCDDRVANLADEKGRLAPRFFALMGGDE